MLNLNGLKELVEVVSYLLPDRRKQVRRKYKLENELLQARIQKTLAETIQISGIISQVKLENLNKALNVVNDNFPELSPTLKLNLALDILIKFDRSFR